MTEQQSIVIDVGRTPRLHRGDRRRHAFSADRSRAATAACARHAHGRDCRCRHRAVDGGRDGADRNLGSETLYPVRARVRTERVLSTFPSIDTAVDHIKISQGLERVAGVMDRGAIIRTFQAADLGYILHSRHQYHWHTGYIPPQTVAMPHIGAVIARTLGPRNPTVPAFIAIGQNMEIGGESAPLKAFHTAGFLGSEHGPFLIPIRRMRPLRFALRPSSATNVS